MADPIAYPRTDTFSQPTSFFDDTSTANKYSLMPLQQGLAEPARAQFESGTGLFLPDVHTLDRLAHFPDDLYDLSDNSHLVRFLRALLGPSGAGQLRQRQTVARLQTLSSNFYDLDAFFGAIFNADRTNGEQVDINGFVDTATQDEWEQYQAADSIYRERLFRMARAINMGGTVPGIQALAEAVTGVECEIYEIWQVLDDEDPNFGVPLVASPYVAPTFSGNRTFGAMEITFASWADAEGAPNWQGLEDGSYVPAGMVLGMGDTTYGLAGGEEVFGFAQRTWGDVQTAFGTFGNMAAPYGPDATWNDIEFVTVPPGPTLTATAYGVNVNCTWTTYVGAIGYRVYKDGEVAYTNGPAGTDPLGNSALVGPFPNNTTHTFQVVPYTAYDSGTDTYTDQTPSNTVSIVVGGSVGSPMLSPEESSRAFFIIRPKTQYDTAEDEINSYHAVSKVVDTIKPAGTRYRVDNKGLELVTEAFISSLNCPDNFWEVITKVTPRRSLKHDPTKVYPISAGQANDGYTQYDTRETTLPAMSNKQGTEFSYNSEAVQVTAYAYDPATETTTNTKDYETVHYHDGTTVDYTADKGLLHPRQAHAARAANDGVLVAAPYSDTRLAVNTHG